MGGRRPAVECISFLGGRHGNQTLTVGGAESSVTVFGEEDIVSGDKASQATASSSSGAIAFEEGALVGVAAIRRPGLPMTSQGDG